MTSPMTSEPTTLSIKNLKAWLAELNDAREPCAACSGTGLAANMAGEPDECRTCHGNTVAPPEEQTVDTATIAALIEGYIAMAEALTEAEPYVETLHSLMGKSDTRKQVMGVIRRMRAALNIGGTND